MKVAIVSTSSAGGAGIAAQRLNEALRSVGADSHLLSFVGESSSSGETLHIGDANSQRLDFELQEIPKALALYRTDISNTYFTFNPIGLSTNAIEQLKSFDIINLHWVDGAIGLRSLLDLYLIGKPIVWTLHDMAFFTGGCHYTAGCTKFQSSCKTCPQLENELSNKMGFDPVARFFNLKKKVLAEPADVNIVTPSRWLEAKCKASVIGSERRSKTIANPLPLGTFRRHDKLESRRVLGIPAEDFVLLFAADHHNEKRKNLSSIGRILRHLENLPTTSYEISILLVGRDSHNLNNITDFRVYEAGHIGSPEQMAKIYSAADLMLHTATEDNLPNTIAEGMACGLPTFAFDVGGISDMIQPGKNGQLFQPNSENELAEQILELIKNRKAAAALSESCLQIAKDMFDPKVQALKYLEEFRFAQVSKTADGKHDDATLRQETEQLAYDIAIWALSENISHSEKESTSLRQQIVQIEQENRRINSENEILKRGPWGVFLRGAKWLSRATKFK